MSRLPVALVLVLALACTSTPPTSGTERVLTINGKEVRYRFTSCSPALRYDANTIAIEGLELPQGTGPVNRFVNFKLAKLSTTPSVQRQITEYTQRYKSLLDETCKTMIMLNGDEARERYAVHRDTLMAKFIESALALEEATSDADVNKVTTAAKSEATNLGTTPKQP